jgi:hypothetical protein
LCVTWSFPGELCGAQTDSSHGFVSTVAEDRYKAALESETGREIRGAGGNSVDAAIACLCQEQGGHHSSLVVPTVPPLAPRLYPHIPLSPLYMFERPYLSVSWNPASAVCAADFSVDPGPEIGLSDIYKRLSTALGLHYRSLQYNGITERSSTNSHRSNRQTNRCWSQCRRARTGSRRPCARQRRESV